MLDFDIGDKVAIKNFNDSVLKRIYVGKVIHVVTDANGVQIVHVLVEGTGEVTFERREADYVMFRVGHKSYTDLVLIQKSDIYGWCLCNCCKESRPRFCMEVGGWWHFATTYHPKVSGGFYCHNCSDDVYRMIRKEKELNEQIRKMGTCISGSH